MAIKIRKIFGRLWRGAKGTKVEEKKAVPYNIWERELTTKEATLQRRIGAMRREENIKALQKQYEAMQEARRKDIWSVGKRAVKGYLEKIRTRPPMEGASPEDIPPVETETVKGVTRWVPPQPQYRWEKNLLDGKWRKVMIH